MHTYFKRRHTNPAQLNQVGLDKLAPLNVLQLPENRRHPMTFIRLGDKSAADLNNIMNCMQLPKAMHAPKEIK